MAFATGQGWDETKYLLNQDLKIATFVAISYEVDVCSTLVGPVN